MTPDDQDLRGKTAFVSGSGRNIGRAIALELARRGCNVVVNGSRDRDSCEGTAEEARRFGVEAMVAMGDVGRTEGVASIAEAALARFRSVDVLVNNAAIRPHKPFLEMTEDDWHRVIDLDLNAAFYTCRAFLPGMVAGRWGRIVSITGMNSISGYKEGAPISAAKHGVWGMTKALAKEFGPHGITINAVSPGPIGGDASDPVKTEAMQKRAAGIPVGYVGEPQDIAAVVGFLCSGSARFITGQMIASNGGAQT